MIQKSLWAIALVCLALFGCSQDDNGSLPGAPTITGMTPAQAGNGAQNVQGTITGTHLSGVTAVDMGGGITVHQFQSTSDTQISVLFSVSGSANAGARTISVTTAGGTASSGSLFSVVINNKPPVASFSVSPGKGNTTTTFTFDASRSHDDGRIVEFRWDFGDGKKASGKKVEHRFEQSGKFSVELKVEDNKGLQAADHNAVNVEKFTAVVCTQKLPYKRVGIFGTVVGVDGNKYMFRTDNNNTCATAFYKCGDFSPPAETAYYGTLCSMRYFGDRLFEVGVINPASKPAVGSRAFIKAQKCKFDPCR